MLMIMVMTTVMIIFMMLININIKFIIIMIQIVIKSVPYEFVESAYGYHSNYESYDYACDSAHAFEYGYDNAYD